MTKKHFIALAKWIIGANEDSRAGFDENQVFSLALFCETQNPRFNRERWLDYIAGKCGPSGGRIKVKGVSK